MNKIIRNIFIVVLLLILLLAFNQSYTSLNIDNLAYVIALAIDVGDNDNLKISFQYTPRTTSSSSDSNSSESSSTVMNSVEAPSVDSAINLMNSFLARELNLSHCKVIVFSEEVAVRGISNEIYSLTNDSQVRPSTNIIVCKNKAKDYLKESNPVLENLLTKYYEIFPNSRKYTGYVYNATLGDFFNELVCDTGEPIAILGGVNTNSETPGNFASDEGIANIKSTDTTFLGFRGSENIGVAVFKDDKLVGELTAIETLCLSGIRGEVESFLIRVPNPENNEKQLDLIIYPANNSKINVDIINGTPYISFKESFTGKIYSMEKDNKYLKPEVLDSISQVANRYLEEILKNYLYKTSVELGADINSFGEQALSNFLTLSEFYDYDWQNNYKNSIFNLSLTTNIQSGFLLTET